MPAYQSVDLDSVPPDGRAGPYQELMRRPGFSVGLYRLPAGGTDHQHPHAADEVYYVLRGRAALLVEDERIDVGPGSVVSVDRGSEHHFIDITEELSLLVIFAPPSTPET